MPASAVQENEVQKKKKEERREGTGKGEQRKRATVDWLLACPSAECLVGEQQLKELNLPNVEVSTPCASADFSSHTWSPLSEHEERTNGCWLVYS